MLTVRNCQILNKYSTMASTTCSWCYKTFFEGNSRFPLKPKQQEYAILKVLNSFRVDFCFKIALFSHFCAGSHIRTKFIQFLSFGESRFPPKKFYNINLILIQSFKTRDALQTRTSFETWHYAEGPELEERHRAGTNSAKLILP